MLGGRANPARTFVASRREYEHFIRRQPAGRVVESASPPKIGAAAAVRPGPRRRRASSDAMMPSRPRRAMLAPRPCEPGRASLSSPGCAGWPSPRRYRLSPSRLRPSPRPPNEELPPGLRLGRQRRPGSSGSSSASTGKSSTSAFSSALPYAARRTTRTRPSNTASGSSLAKSGASRAG
jgi:hypothetical protein